MSHEFSINGDPDYLGGGGSTLAHNIKDLKGRVHKILKKCIFDKNYAKLKQL